MMADADNPEAGPDGEGDGSDGERRDEIGCNGRQPKGRATWSSYLLPKRECECEAKGRAYQNHHCPCEPDETVEVVRGQQVGSPVQHWDTRDKEQNAGDSGSVGAEAGGERAAG